MYRVHFHCPFIICAGLCWLLSACSSLSHQATTPTAKPLALRSLKEPATSPAPAANQNASARPLPAAGAQTLLRVAIGDDQATVRAILGSPDRSTQVATSNGERVAWEYFTPAAQSIAAQGASIQCLIIFDQETGRVKTIERYP